MWARALPWSILIINSNKYCTECIVSLYHYIIYVYTRFQKILKKKMVALTWEEP